MNFNDLQDALAALHFLRPQWLWALLALPALAWAWRARQRRQNAWRGVVDAHLLPHLLERGHAVRGSMAPWLALLGLVLALLALSGPSWRKGDQPWLQGAAPLVIALDLSSTMLANDLPPSRLLQARAKLAALLQQRAGGQVGMVVFADDAYTVAPLTDDADNVALFLDALSPDIMPVDAMPDSGSNAARAIVRSAKLLRQAGYTQGTILVLSDHADVAARSAASEAGRSGYRVSALGLGSAGGAAYRNAQGGIANTHLDSGSLQALAVAGGGRYAALADDASDLKALGVLDAASMHDAVAAHNGKAGVWRDDGYWLLLPLMLLAMFAFRRGGMLAVVLLCTCLPWLPARAADGGTLWQRADQVQHARMQSGIEAYRKQDFAGALRAWESLPGAEAAYNRGNALAESGRLEDAIAQYQQALRLGPAMDDAAANKKAVEAAMKRKPPPARQPDSPGKQRQTPQTGKQKDGTSGQQDGAGSQSKPQSDAASNGAQQQQSGDTSRPKPQDTNQQEKSPPESATAPRAGDAKAQRDADAEQRARMQQALQGNPQGKQQARDGQAVEGEPKQAQRAADREKQLANEAWLQRVPDDPGGLLRAKFRLEYQRRQETGEH